MSDLSGRNVLITGAASGLGRVLCEKMAARGAQLVLWDIDAAGLETLRAELESKSCKVWTAVCDISDRHAVRETGRKTLEQAGHVDVLINNAGIVSGKDLLQISDEQIERTFAVNTLALFWVTRAFLASMLERDRGHVVTIASAAGLAGTSKMTDYCASKAAAVGFDESLRMELRSLGSAVKTTVVCPFYVSTGMFEGAKSRFDWLLPILTPEYAAERIVDAIRRGRQRLIMPRMVYSVYLARLLPVNVFDALMDFLGVTRSMEDFVGRR